MRIKDILWLLIIGFIIYLDYKWFFYINKNIIGFWYFVNTVIIVVFLITFIVHLQRNTLFFEKLNKILNKRIL
jgi:hypothetical protein